MIDAPSTPPRPTAREHAKRLLIYYLKGIAQQAGMVFTTTDAQHVGQIVDDIIAAANER